MAQYTRIAELATTIKEQTDLLDEYFRSNGLPSPSLDETAPIHLPIPETAPHIQEARVIVIEATNELNAIMKGPGELLRVPWTEHVGLHAAVRFNIAKSFPTGETTSFKKIAEFSGLSERNVRCLLRHCMTSYVFKEPESGVVAHTALSKLLAQNDMVYNNALNSLDNMWPAACKVVDALVKWPNSEEPNETAFALANNSDQSMWDIYKEAPQRGEIFARAMGSMDAVKGYEPSVIVQSFPWESLGEATVVDLGGSHGSVMITLARAFPKLKCIVQDLPEVVEEGKLSLPADVASQVSFQAHDFFTPQTVAADVYYTRSIMHNWSDKYCIRILRNLIPVLRPQARLLIHELVMPPPNTLSVADEKRIRHLDVGMLQLLNAHQRDAEEFIELFAAADARFHVVNIQKPVGGAQHLIEVMWS